MADDGKFSIFLQMNLRGSIHVLGRKFLRKIHGLMVNKDIGLYPKDLSIISYLILLVIFQLSVTAAEMVYFPKIKMKSFPMLSAHHAPCFIAAHFPMKQTGEKREMFILTIYFHVKLTKA